MELDFLSKTSNSCDMLFSDMAEIYMDDCKARIRPTTYKGKEDIIEVHIMPYFRNLKVNEIQPMNVRRWQTELMNNQKNYKPTCTQRGSSAQLRACAASSSTIKFYTYQILRGMGSNGCPHAFGELSNLAHSVRFCVSTQNRKPACRAREGEQPRYLR